MAPPGYEQEGHREPGTFPARSRFRGRPRFGTTARSRPGRAPRDLRREGHHPRQGDPSVLPHRRALSAHVVRSPGAPRLRERPNYDGSWTEWGNLVEVPIEAVDARVRPRAADVARASGVRRGRAASDRVADAFDDDVAERARWGSGAAPCARARRCPRAGSAPRPGCRSIRSSASRRSPVRSRLRGHRARLLHG